MVPLHLVETCETFRIAQLSGKDEIRMHLHDLGFTPGMELKVVSRVGGNVIVALKDARVALDVTLAKRIIVVPA